MTFEEILAYSPYSLMREEKERLLTTRLVELTEYHRKKCPEYNAILDSVSYNHKKVSSYKDLPFLPVRLFKERALKSVMQEDVIKIMISSGTSGQAVSKIYLDRVTSSNQQKAMVKIVSDFTGNSRMPMIILDCPSVVKDRKMFSARGAGILGFSVFGTKKIYAFNDEMQLDVEALQSFLETYKNQRILLFGFTYMIWQYFYKELLRLREHEVIFDLSNAVLIHGGGWKKLINEAVSQQVFRKCLYEVCNLKAIHDYYGMVEQTGCIYMQCECGHLHASIFSDIIIRNPRDFSVLPHGERGIIQVVSTIPESYPGHSLLTEDEGMILGEDDCLCGRKGKYFKVFGRIKNAEVRGCSDTYLREKTATAFCDTSKDDSFFSKLQFLVGDVKQLQNMKAVKQQLYFEEEVMDFLGEVSKMLMADPRGRNLSDIVSLGFWLRKASLVSLKKRFTYNDKNIRKGRGLIFHIAPSNVPVNYAYSLCSGLLCGNANVVRLPSKDFVQIEIINGAIKKALEKYPKLKDYICLVKYDREPAINEMLSKICDVRIVWGGDATITELRSFQLSPKATEITFADRYSLAIIDSDTYMKLEQKERVVINFYNDTYLTDQNACTSPRMIVWMGNAVADAKRSFWAKLQELVNERYRYQAIMGVDKLSQAYLAVTAEADFGKISVNAENDYSLVRIQVAKAPYELMEYRGNCGYFYEYDCKNIMELSNICDNDRCQTIGVLGDKKMLEPLIKSGIRGIDRVVDIGHTMDFDLNWDGYNLVERLTRTVVF